MKSTLTLWIVLVVASILITGCNQSEQINIEELDVAPAIETDCIVHYFKSNASAYITRQKHGYNPSATIFHSVSDEPTGPVECLLTKEKFSYTGQKPETLSDLPRDFWDNNLAISIFYSFCGGGDLLDTGSMKVGENFKIEGQWYKPLTPQWSGKINVTLFQSLDTNRIELLKMEDAQQGLKWMLRGYNYRYSKELQKLLPRTIDVYDIYEGIASKTLMIRFDYKNIQKVGI